MHPLSSCSPWYFLSLVSYRASWFIFIALRALLIVFRFCFNGPVILLLFILWCQHTIILVIWSLLLDWTFIELLFLRSWSGCSFSNIPSHWLVIFSFFTFIVNLNSSVAYNLRMMFIIFRNCVILLTYAVLWHVLFQT